MEAIVLYYGYNESENTAMDSKALLTIQKKNNHKNFEAQYVDWKKTLNITLSNMPSR